MRKLLLFHIIGLSICFGCSSSEINLFETDTSNSIHIDTLKNFKDFKNLINCYPNFISKISGNYIIWQDGTKMLIDDGIINKNFDSLLNYPDFEDQFIFSYKPGKLIDFPIYNYDPGRIRYDPFFKKMYGETKQEVEKNLVEIVWLPKTINKRIRITSVNGINEKLQQISNELDTLPNKFKKYLINIGGTFNWRNISGTQRLSAHSYGIAIDINANYSNYWRWDYTNNGKYVYKNQIPIKIVEIFEKHGFIWGGKWYHYDTMHFEYRPELFFNLK